MEFRILGPLGVWDGCGEVSLGGPKPRALLAVLLLHPNEVVPADRLIDELWGEDSPERAAAALRVNVSRLRKALPQDQAAECSKLSPPSGFCPSNSTDSLFENSAVAWLPSKTTRSTVASANDSRNSEPH